MIYISVKGKFKPNGEPVIRCQLDDEPFFMARRVELTGPSALVTTDDEPCERAGGVHTWIETEYPAIASMGPNHNVILPGTSELRA